MSGQAGKQVVPNETFHLCWQAIMMDSQNLHGALLKADAWPDAQGPVEFCETHASRLYFVGERVYKVKKPVDFGFLNFTSLDRRRFYCHEELRLNDRFAPDTYLGVVELRRDGTGVRVDGPGEVVDYAVVMRRLPRDQMLDVMIEIGAEGLPEAMTELGRRLATLHSESEVVREGGADLARVQHNWRENFEQLAPLVGSILSPRALALSQEYVARFLDEWSPLLLEREVRGEVRDAHGDLHAEHICLTKPLRIYDCIEFNRRFRVADKLADLAFLLMDLEFRGRGDLAGWLLNAYCAEGSRNPELNLLLPFYKFYRAWVRGKVDTFLANDQQATTGTRASAAVLAKRYFNQALGYLCPPQLVITCGLMGSGKSSLASPLATALDAVLLRSDVVRKELAGDRSRNSDQAPFGTGIYRTDFSRTTYRRLKGLSFASLSAGRSVVVDAAFGGEADRRSFRSAAAAAGVPCTVLWTDCARDLALARLAGRCQAGDAISDGRPELYDRQAAIFVPPGNEGPLLRVDTAGDVDYTVQLVLTDLAAGVQVGS